MRFAYQATGACGFWNSVGLISRSRIRQSRLLRLQKNKTRLSPGFFIAKRVLHPFYGFDSQGIQTEL